jgi:CrcB protein
MQTAPDFHPVLAICIGASVGALARWQLSLWLNPGPGAMYSFPDSLPWGTLMANLLGGYLIGVAVGLFQGLPGIDPIWRLVLITGFLGALTTFSSFSMEVVTMLENRQMALALLTSTAHLVGSLLATGLGLISIRALLLRII